jgi:hypothetical protein
MLRMIDVTIPGRRRGGCDRDRGLPDLALNEAQYVARAPHHPLVRQALPQHDAEHLAWHLEVGGHVRVRVLLLHGICDQRPEHVVDNAVTPGVYDNVVVEGSYQQSVMLEVEFAAYPGVGPPQRQHRIEEGHKVLSHVRVGTVANPQFPRPELRTRLQHCTQDVAARARDC